MGIHSCIKWWFELCFLWIISKAVYVLKGYNAMEKDLTFLVFACFRVMVSVYATWLGLRRG